MGLLWAGVEEGTISVESFSFSFFPSLRVGAGRLSGLRSRVKAVMEPTDVVGLVVDADGWCFGCWAAMAVLRLRFDVMIP